MAATVAGMFSVAYSLRFTVDVFWGPAATDLPLTPHEPPHWMRVPVELLVLACLVVGMLPAWSVGDFLRQRPRPVVGGDLPAFSLAVWHGLNMPLVMSLVALLGGGVVLYLALRWQRAKGTLDAPPLCTALTASASLRVAGTPEPGGGRSGRRCLGTERLQWQMLWLVCAALASGHHSALVPRPAHGNRTALPAVTRLCGAVGDWRCLRRGSCLASQIPPPGGPHADGRRRACVQHHLPVVLCTRPGPHTADGGNGHHRTDLAGPALAAEA